MILRVKKLFQAKNTFRLLHSNDPMHGPIDRTRFRRMSVKIHPENERTSHEKNEKGPFRNVLRLPVSSCFQQLSRLVFWEVRSRFIQGSPG